MVNAERFLRGLSMLVGQRRDRVDDWPGMAEKVRGGAAFLAQGASFSYLRARTGMMGPRLFQDAAFGAALEICKWEGFAAAAQDLILIIEGEARPHYAGDRRALPAALVALYEAALALEPPPAHRAGTGWEDMIEEFRPRAAFAVEAPVRPAAEIAVHTGARLMAFAPVEDRIRESDAEMVGNNVAFRFTDFKRRLRAEIDMAAAARALAGRAAELEAAR